MKKLSNAEIIFDLNKQISIRNSNIQRKNDHICELESDNGDYEEEIKNLQNDYAKSLELNERYLTILTNMSESKVS